MANAEQEGVTGANNFYRDYSNVFIIALIASFFLMLGILAWVLYQVKHRPIATFVANSNTGKQMLLTAFDEPNYLPSTLSRWASMAAVAAYTFDFVNYEKQMAAARPYFTAEGWAGFQPRIQALIADIRQKQLFVNSVVSGTPIISNQGYFPGKGYTWRMQMPFLVTYQSSDTASRQGFYLILTIVKVPTSVDPTGIGIDQFVMR